MKNNYVMLNNVEHQDLRVITDRSAKYGDDVNFAMTFPLEFQNIQACYPIFFRKDEETGKFYPVALLGFEPRENLFLTESGWDAHYVPLSIRRHPFIIGFQQVKGEGDTRKPVVSIDLGSPRVSKTEGEALFLPHGGTSDYLSSMTELLESIHLGHEMITVFIDALTELNLIESVNLGITLKDGSKNQLIGYYTINEEKLQQLDGEALARLHGYQFLHAIYMIIASLSCFRTLIEKKNDKINSA